LVEQFGIDDVRIEVVRDPRFQFDMALVLCFDQCIEKLGEAPGSTDVLRWAAADGFEQARIAGAGCRIEQAFDLIVCFQPPPKS
jgi:hypothetical protein